MRKKIVACSFFLLCISSVFSQLIDNRLGNAFEDEMFFNEQFLADNGIITIRGESYLKRTSRPMRKLSNEEIYHFSGDGHLSKLYKIRELFGELDTLHFLWKYNDNDKIIQRTETDSRGFYIVRMVRNEDGNVKKRLFYRIRNKGRARDDFVPGEEFLVNTEEYEYSFPNDTTKIITTLNNHGLPYKEEMIVRNELGYLIKERKKFVVSNQVETTTYEYNNKGWITSVTTQYFPLKDRESKEFEYDDFGNLLFVSHLKSGTETHRTELIYDEAMLLHSIIHRELSSNLMDITKYFYTFR